ncbi:D-isomer specific 2-hydroxyacid dehydrogenase [Macleaya cordata]|uniref:D-isomer specific 2-hydroxyacid dehydrogenase n=1 Tax=Macleaya cordata TaxID=56857 RepID=A0A200PPN9_MACCD|nr:D-isomer specific 2-hydroxyacid dehydrogenase [Macleaya cordata]
MPSPRGIVVGYAGTVFSVDVADFAVGLLIDVLRRISFAHRFIRAGLWPLPLGSKQLPLVLTLFRFPFIPSFEEQFSEKFRALKRTDLSEPLNQFLTKHAQSVRALICGAGAPVNIETLNHLPSLSCVLTVSAGLDHIDLPECRRRGIVVGNASTVYSEDVADFAVGLLIDVLRRISSADRFVRTGLWPLKGEYPLGSKLGGKRVGIVGLGSIGSEVAKRLEAFGCVISYNSRKKKPSVPFPYYSNVIDLAANSDVLIISCELNNETFHIINKDVMSALGKKGVIINVGRGALIDEKELVRCLVKGEIGGAGLDVFENEPHVPKELFELDNVVLAPHKAVLTPESFSALHELVIANLEAFFSNKPLVSLVKND